MQNILTLASRGAIALIAALVFAIVAPQSATAQVNTNRMMQVGRNALYFEDYVLSIQYFNRVINVKPYLADPYYYRAIAKFYLDDLNGCEADCDVALNINPFLVSAYNLRGIARLRLRRNEEARTDFEQGLKYEPENINLMMNNGVALINLKEYDSAIDQYDNLLTYDRQNVPAMLYKGIATVEKGDTLAALKEFEKAAKVNAYSSDAFTYLGMLAYQMKDYESALKHYDRLAKLRPLDANVYVNRGITKYNLEDLRGCAADLDEALRLDPKNKMALQNRGMLRAESGDLNRAADDFSHLLALDPSDDIALFNRAMIYSQLGQTTKAMQDLNIIIAKHPDFGPAYGQRAVVKRMMGDDKGAEVDYMTAMTFEQDRIRNALNQNADTKNGKDDGKDKKEEQTKHKESRSKNDADMRKYDQMVVVADFGDHDDKLSTENKDKIRGRVQDRDIAIDLEPVFGLTFFSADTLLPNAKYYRQSVENFNAKGIAEQKMVLSNRENVSDAVTAKAYMLRSDADKRIDTDPGNADLYTLRATLNSVTMNYTNAIADYGVTILKRPDDALALFGRAATRYKMVETIRSMDSDVNTMEGSDMMVMQNVRTDVTILDYDLIWRDLARVIELEPSNEFAYYNMSLVLCQRKQMDRAIESLDMAISINPQFAEAYFNRGIIRIYLGDETAGVTDLSKAGELGMFKAYNVIKRYSTRDSGE